MLPSTIKNVSNMNAIIPDEGENGLLTGEIGHRTIDDGVGGIELDNESNRSFKCSSLLVTVSRLFFQYAPGSTSAAGSTKQRRVRLLHISNSQSIFKLQEFASQLQLLATVVLFRIFS